MTNPTSRSPTGDTTPLDALCECGKPKALHWGRLHYCHPIDWAQARVGEPRFRAMHTTEEAAR